MAEYLTDKLQGKALEDFERVYGRKPTLAERVEMATHGMSSVTTKKLLDAVAAARDVYAGVYS